MARATTRGLAFLFLLIASECINTSHAISATTAEMGWKQSDLLRANGDAISSRIQRKNEAVAKEARRLEEIHFNTYQHSRHANILHEFLEQEAKISARKATAGDDSDSSVEEENIIAGPDAQLVRLTQKEGVRAFVSEAEHGHEAGNVIDGDWNSKTVLSYKGTEGTKAWMVVDLGYVVERIESLRLWGGSDADSCWSNKGYIKLMVTDSLENDDLSSSDLQNVDDALVVDPAKTPQQESDLPDDHAVKFQDFPVKRSGRFIVLKRHTGSYGCTFDVSEIEAFGYDPPLYQDTHEHTNPVRHADITGTTLDTELTSDEVKSLNDGHFGGRDVVFQSGDALSIDLKYSQRTNILRIWPKLDSYTPVEKPSGGSVRAFARNHNRGMDFAEARGGGVVAILKQSDGSEIRRKTFEPVSQDGRPFEVDIKSPGDNVRFIELQMGTFHGTVRVTEVEVLTFPRDIENTLEEQGHTSGTCDEDCQYKVGRFLCDESLSHGWWNHLKLQVRRRFNEAMHGHKKKQIRTVMLASSFEQWNREMSPGKFYGFDHELWVNADRVREAKNSPLYLEAYETTMLKVKADTVKSDMIKTCNADGCEKTLNFFATAIHKYITETATNNENAIVKWSALSRLRYFDEDLGREAAEFFIQDRVPAMDFEAMHRDKPEAMYKVLRPTLNHALKSAEGDDSDSSASPSLADTGLAGDKFMDIEKLKELEQFVSDVGEREFADFMREYTIFLSQELKKQQAEEVNGGSGDDGGDDSVGGGKGGIERLTAVKDAGKAMTVVKAGTKASHSIVLTGNEAHTLHTASDAIRHVDEISRHVGHVGAAMGAVGIANTAIGHTKTAVSDTKTILDLVKDSKKAELKGNVRLTKVGTKVGTKIGGRVSMSIRNGAKAFQHNQLLVHTFDQNANNLQGTIPQMDIGTVALSGLGTALSIVTFVMVLQNEEADIVEKVYSGISMTLSIASFTLLVLQHIPTFVATAGPSAMGTLSVVATWLGCAASIFSAAFAIYGAVRAFQKGETTVGILKTVAACLLVADAVLGILLAASVCAATGVGAIVSAVLVIAASVILIIATFFGPKPEPETPAEDDERVALIQEAQDEGLLYHKIKFGIHQNLKCSEENPFGDRLEEKLRKYCVPPPVPSSKTKPYKSGGRTWYQPDINWRMWSYCMGNDEMHTLLTYVFSTKCVYASGALNWGAAHHIVPYWIRRTDIDYNKEKDERFWWKNWDPAMKDAYERNEPPSKGESYHCARNGECESYCGVDWSGGEACYTGFGEQRTKCTHHSDCNFYDPCVSYCNVF